MAAVVINFINDVTRNGAIAAAVVGKVRVILNLTKINTAASCIWQGRNDGGGEIQGEG